MSQGAGFAMARCGTMQAPEASFIRRCSAPQVRYYWDFLTAWAAPGLRAHRFRRHCFTHLPLQPPTSEMPTHHPTEILQPVALCPWRGRGCPLPSVQSALSGLMLPKLGSKMRSRLGSIEPSCRRLRCFASSWAMDLRACFVGRFQEGLVKRFGL